MASLGKIDIQTTQTEEEIENTNVSDSANGGIFDCCDDVFSDTSSDNDDDFIEIEKNAADEAAQNVKNSKWSDRVSIQHISFQDFVATALNKFDLIVSNPPFFSNGVKNTNPHLSMARHNHLLPFEDIINGSKMLLSKNGMLSLILPAGSVNEFIEKALFRNLFLSRLTEVKPFPDSKPNRCLMEFRKVQDALQKTEMLVFDETRKDYSKEFKTLARDFYLKL